MRSSSRGLRMPSIEEGINDYLSGLSAVTALIGTDPVRLYPMRMPEKFAGTTLVYAKISGPRQVSHSGDSNLIRSRFQFSSWAKTYDDARSLSLQVTKAFSGIAATLSGIRVGAAEVENDLDDFDDETKLYRRLVDVVLWHEEAS